ncbi:MAG: membrane protein insertion efficiency factor YidD [Pseudomonadota bacterium]
MKHTIRGISIFFIISLVMIRLSPGMAAEEKIVSRSNGSQNTTGASFSIGAWLVSAFRDHISAVDGDRCPSYPSCSSYSVRAIKNHGFFMGWMMTVDRLIHEGSEEVEVTPFVLSEGKWKIYDPVENNDFWWYGSNDHEMGMKRDHDPSNP